MGNGSNIEIWRDKRIQNPSSFKVQSLVRILDRVGKVKEFIYEDTGW